MLITKDNIDFKKVNKNLKRELSGLGFDISNQSCLNLLSRSLGYKNYNTYLALNPEVSNIQRESIREYLINETAHYLDFKDKEYLSEYEEIEKVVYLTEFNIYNVFVDKESSSSGDRYFLQFKLKKDETKRVFFSPTYETFSLFVGPTIEEAHEDYDFDIRDIEEKEHLKSSFRDTIKHVGQKFFYNKKIHNDLVDLMDAIYNDRKVLSSFTKQYPEEVLKDKYDSLAPTFYQ